MPHDGLDNLITHRVDRIERGHRLLKDHGDLAAPKIGQLALAHGMDLVFTDADAAGQFRTMARIESDQRA